MTLSSEKSNNKLCIKIAGDIDVSTVKEIRGYIDNQLEKDSYNCVILDMENVDFMDSTGIGMLLARYKKLRNENTPLYVKNINTQIDKVFRVSGLYQIIKAV